jgi:energy-coupling factor transporter transmembrane protein EcfT
MACISIFFVVSYFIQKINKKKIFILIHLILLIIIFPIFPKNNYYQVNIYPTLGYVDLKNQFISNKELFRKTNIKFFGQHQFNEETIEYYNDIRSVICTYDKIINYSIDRTLVYICDKKNNIISTVNWYPIFFNNSQLDRKYKNESIQENEIVIADYNFSNPNLKLIKKINLPKYTRFTKADVFRQQFDDQLFFYIKKK